MSADDAVEVGLDPNPSEGGQRARACLLGGAVGDALGAPIEFYSLANIRQRFGPGGLRDYVAGNWPAGSITDDTQMTLFTAEGLIRAAVRFDFRGVCHRPSIVCHAYLRWLVTQTIEWRPSLEGSAEFLLSVPELYARRAPGRTCLSALESKKGGVLGTPATNNSKGCGAVMRMAPVGVMGARGGPGALQQTFSLGTECAALTHGHPTGHLAAGAFAGLIAQLMMGVPLAEANRAICAELKRHPSHEETLRALEGATAAARSRPACAETVESLGAGWVAEEALAIGVYSALVSDNFEDGVVLAVNHSGDSDSTGSIAGNILGTIYGEQSIPSGWLAGLELRQLIERVAEDLWDYPDLRWAAASTPEAVSAQVAKVYPPN